jgi:hypothetical protein
MSEKYLDIWISSSGQMFKLVIKVLGVTWKLYLEEKRLNDKWEPNTNPEEILCSELTSVMSNLLSSWGKSRVIQEKLREAIQGKEVLMKGSVYRILQVIQ